MIPKKRVTTTLYGRTTSLMHNSTDEDSTEKQIETTTATELSSEPLLETSTVTITPKPITNLTTESSTTYTTTEKFQKPCKYHQVMTIKRNFKFVPLVE